MAFFTDTTTAPRIVLRTTYRTDDLFILAGAVFTQFTRTVTTTDIEHTGLTQASADTIAAGKNDTTTQAYSKRMNKAGMYKVVVTTDSSGAWA